MFKDNNSEMRGIQWGYYKQFSSGSFVSDAGMF